MEGISTRTWAAIGVMGLIVFLSYWARFSVKHPGWNPLTMGFTYQMARSQGFEPGFDLSDRDVERLIQGGQGGKKVAALTDATKKAAEQKLDPKLVAQKDAEAKKRQEEQAKAKATADAAARKAMNATKKVDVNVVDTSLESGLSASDEAMAPTAASFTGPAPASVAKNTTTATPVGEEIKKEEETILSATQWRALLQTAPTSENITKFVAAKRSGKLDSASYYQIVHELLTDSADDRRAAALSALDQDVSAETYVFMVTESSASSDSDMQAKLKTRIDQYATASRIGFLNQVLTMSQNAAVLQSAATNLTTALAAYKAQNSEQSQGENGPIMSGGFSAQQFMAFLPTLQSLAQNSSSPIASQATQLATEIQNLNQVATNP